MRERTSIGVALAAVLTGLLVTTLVHAQVSPPVRDKILREARELARVGNREAAIRKVETLYSRDPLDGTVVQALASLLTEEGELERAKDILDGYTAKRPGDTRALSTLASLHLQSGERERGTEILEKIVDRAPDELWPYQVGLDALTVAGMEDEMIGFIERARRAVGDSTVFAVDAARIHQGAERFGAATREYLRAGIAENMSPEISAEYIVSMAGNEEARPAVIGTLEKARPIAPFRQTVARSLGEVYLMNEDCDLALQVIAELVETDPSLASVLIIFARKASRAGCHAKCAEAYGLMVTHVDKAHKVAEYLLEKARCEEAAGLLDDALTTFEVVASRYRTHKAADDALMGRAGILRDRGELTEAVAEAERIMESRYADNVHEALLFKADCLVLMGDLEDAFRTYDRVGTEWEPEYAQEAFFNLGEVNLYRGEFDDAQSYYNVTLRRYPDEPRANDAIDRLLLIKSSGGEGTYVPALGDFAQALLLRRQGDTEQAVGLLKELGGVEGQEPIRVESLKVLAEIYLEQGNPDDAVRTYRLVGDSLDAPSSPSALEAIGDIYLGLGRIEDAVKAYEDVILKFPESVSAGEARRKIDLATRGPDDEA